MIFFVSGCAAMASTEMPARLFIFPSPDGWLLLLLRDHQHMTTTLVTPGEPLFPASTHAPGPGTHVAGGSVCASLVGAATVVDGPDGQVSGWGG